MLFHLPRDRVQLVLREPTRFCHFYGIEPELCHLSLVLNVDMGRLASVAAGEEESELADDPNRGHARILPRDRS